MTELKKKYEFSYASKGKLTLIIGIVMVMVALLMITDIVVQYIFHEKVTKDVLLNIGIVYQIIGFIFMLLEKLGKNERYTLKNVGIGFVILGLLFQLNIKSFFM